MASLSPLIFLFLLSAGLAVPGSSRLTDWYETVTPHFRIRHEAAFSPPGLALNLEKIHNRLRLDLAMFSPWMAKERIILCLYAGQRSYLEGEFSPPAWSNGMAYYERKLLAVHDLPDRKKLMEVVSHEMTHLLFESYWGEIHRSPPHWLNEGLAMMEENERGGEADKSAWAQSMGSLPADRLIPFVKLVEISPTTDLKDKNTVSFWYIQSYSVVYYLYRQHTRLQFLNFCRLLRDGKTLKSALWDVYRFRSLEAFEESWKDWLVRTYRNPRGGGKLGGAAPQRPGSPFASRSKLADFNGGAFHSLRGDGEESGRR